jgi:DNA-binding GntR family transcriptional regulator
MSVASSGNAATRDERPAKRRAYDHVRDLILRHESEEPQFFQEETVALELGMSRTPVREAFLMLEAEGFLRLRPRKGAFVVPITARDVREVMEVRAVVETWSARQVLGSPERREALLTAMRAWHDELADLGNHPTELVEADRRFHRELVSATDNRVMLDLYERLRDRQLRMGVRAVLSAPSRVESVRREHQAILDALESNDEATLIDAITDHLARTQQSLDHPGGGA